MFTPCETFNGGHWYISAQPDDLMKSLGMSQSYQLLAARLLGFSYPDYLRYGREKGARIVGREGYSILIFDQFCKVKNFCDELNAEYQKFCVAALAIERNEDNGKDN